MLLNDINLVCVLWIFVVAFIEFLYFCVGLYLAYVFECAFKNNDEYPAWVKNAVFKIDAAFICRVIYKNKPELQQAFIEYTNIDIKQFNFSRIVFCIIVPLVLFFWGLKYNDIINFFAKFV